MQESVNDSRNCSSHERDRVKGSRQGSTNGKMVAAMKIPAVTLHMAYSRLAASAEKLETSKMRAFKEQ